MTNIDKAKIGERIKAEREKRKITQAELGTKLGQSIESAQTKVSKLENGTSLNVETLIKLSEIFHVSTDYLLGISRKEEILSKITLGEAFKYLFELEQLGLSIHIENTEELEPHPYTGEPYRVNIEHISITFTNSYLNQKLKEWENVMRLCSGKDEIYKRLYEVWRAETIRDETVLCGEQELFEEDLPFN